MERKIMNPIRAIFEEYCNNTLNAEYFATAAALTCAIEEAVTAVEEGYKAEISTHYGITEIIAMVVNVLLEAGDPTEDPTSVLCQVWNTDGTLKAMSNALGPAEQEAVEQGLNEDEIWPINGSKLIPHIMEGCFTGRPRQTATLRTKAAFKWLEEHCAHSESVGDQLRADPNSLWEEAKSHD